MEPTNKKNKIISYIISLIVLGILIVADQITKIAIIQGIPENTSLPIVEPLLYFYHVKNEGAAFSMLSGKQIFFIVLTFVMLIMISIVYFKTPITKKYRVFRYVLVVLSAGAIGNLIDRIGKGVVTDFIDTRLIYQLTSLVTGGKFSYNFPIYNFADICVTLSVLVLIILILFVFKDKDFEYLKPQKKSKTFTDTEVYTIHKNNEVEKTDDESRTN